MSVKSSLISVTGTLLEPLYSKHKLFNLHRDWCRVVTNLPSCLIHNFLKLPPQTSEALLKGFLIRTYDIHKQHALCFTEPPRSWNPRSNDNRHPGLTLGSRAQMCIEITLLIKCSTTFPVCGRQSYWSWWRWHQKCWRTQGLICLWTVWVCCPMKESGANDDCVGSRAICCAIILSKWGSLR